MSIIFKAVRLAVLDAHETEICHASGFFIHRGEECRLCTCWHVVTGLDFFQPSVTASYWPPHRRKLRIEFNGNPAPTSVPPGLHQTLSLYDDSSGSFRPMWRQEQQQRPHKDLDEVGIKIPRSCDVVSMSVSIAPEVLAGLSTSIEEVEFRSPVIGSRVIIVGFPYGYTIGVATLNLPIALTRFTASYEIPRSPESLLAGAYLLDGKAAPAMSGAPVFMDLGNFNMKLIGIYTGCIFPDEPLLSKSSVSGRQVNDRNAALGVVCCTGVIRDDNL